MQLSFDFVGRRIALAMLVLACGVTSAAAADWPYWRGPSFDGKAEATGLPDDWDPAGGWADLHDSACPALNRS